MRTPLPRRWLLLAGLRVEDVDFLRRTVTIRRTLSDINGEIVIGPPKTNASRATIALPQFVVESLNDLLRMAPRGPEDVFFTSPEGGLIRPSSWRRRAWDPAVNQSLVGPCRFHDLRHTHAALLISQGEHPKVIQERMRHRSIRTTLDTYGHLMAGLDSDVADRLDALAVQQLAPPTRPHDQLAPSAFHQELGADAV